MNLESQVCTVEQAQKLVALGVTKDSFFWSQGQSHQIIYFTDSQKASKIAGHIPRWTSGELGVMLPEIILKGMRAYSLTLIRDNELGFDYSYIHHEEQKWNDNIPNGNKFRWESNEAVARAALLIYLLENKLISVEEVNQRLQ